MVCGGVRCACVVCAGCGDGRRFWRASVGACALPNCGRCEAVRLCTTVTARCLLSTHFPFDHSVGCGACTINSVIHIAYSYCVLVKVIRVLCTCNAPYRVPRTGGGEHGFAPLGVHCTHGHALPDWFRTGWVGRGWVQKQRRPDRRPRRLRALTSCCSFGFDKEYACRLSRFQRSGMRIPDPAGNPLAEILLILTLRPGFTKREPQLHGTAGPEPGHRRPPALLGGLLSPRGEDGRYDAACCLPALCAAWDVRPHQFCRQTEPTSAPGAPLHSKLCLSACLQRARACFSSFFTGYIR